MPTSRVTHTNKSCHLYNELCHTYERVVSHIRMSRVIYTHKSCHIHRSIVLHIQLSHVTYRKRVVPHIRMSCVTHTTTKVERQRKWKENESGKKNICQEIYSLTHAPSISLTHTTQTCQACTWFVTWIYASSSRIICTRDMSEPQVWVQWKVHVWEYMRVRDESFACDMNIYVSSHINGVTRDMSESYAWMEGVRVRDCWHDLLVGVISHNFTCTTQTCHACKQFESCQQIGCVRHSNESCHICDWIMSHVQTSRVTVQMSRVTNEPCQSCVTHRNESCSISEWVVPDERMSHATHTNESCHRHTTHRFQLMNQSRRTMSRTKMSRVTHTNESCHTHTTHRF